MNKEAKLFLGDYFYPSGGYDDFRRSFLSIEEAKEWTEINFSFEDGMDKWAQIVVNDKIVLQGELSGYLNSRQTSVWKWENNES